MAAEHIIKSYDEELSRLNKMIVEMGGLAESQLAASIEAVAKRDSDLKGPDFFSAIQDEYKAAN